MLQNKSRTACGWVRVNQVDPTNRQQQSRRACPENYQATTHDTPEINRRFWSTRLSLSRAVVPNELEVAASVLSRRTLHLTGEAFGGEVWADGCDKPPATGPNKSTNPKMQLRILAP
ncbi:hypothetical protein [Bradyrhizobium liaoningense]|uniref:hypothetical protein n=1 Tax=Bradyrhizobium liaoningense TaxID=43992 RepID=UPI001BA9AA7D|nr:hypothetical protein [Bradyrhizobium liaoningense]MBR1033210.1 hypothetical protein [Bradyrhizobium liaoningense]